MFSKLYDGRPIVPACLTGEQPKRRRGRVLPQRLPYVEIPRADDRGNPRRAVACTAQPPPLGTTQRQRKAILSSIVWYRTTPADWSPNAIWSFAAIRFFGSIVCARTKFLISIPISRHCRSCRSPSAWNCWPKWRSLRSAASSRSGSSSCAHYNWIALDEGSRTVGLEAHPLSSADGLVRVTARIRDGAGMPFVEAVVVLADAVRPPDPSDTTIHATCEPAGARLAERRTLSHRDVPRTAVSQRREFGGVGRHRIGRMPCRYTARGLLSRRTSSRPCCSIRFFSMQSATSRHSGSASISGRTSAAFRRASRRSTFTMPGREDTLRWLHCRPPRLRAIGHRALVSQRRVHLSGRRRHTTVSRHRLARSFLRNAAELLPRSRPAARGVLRR